MAKDILIEKHIASVGLLLMMLVLGCRTTSDKQIPHSTNYFEALDSNTTGISFANNLQPSANFNMFEYMYFYNGAGLGAGDLNNDGLVDLVFAGNQVANRLYLNKGNLKFTDITSSTGITNDSAWSTGISLVDINNDGMLDIYVCRASRFKELKGRNQLWVCEKIENGIPIYTEQAESYGIAFEGLSTQAAFFDYDMDGDLDMFLLNHAPGHTGRFAERSRFLGTYDAISGDRLFRRDGNQYNDVTKQSGIHSSAIGYGLGISIADINMDGWPDIYVGNDFHENDYIYINTGEGTFVDEATIRTMHTSQFTMGVDIGDITNDGFPEIVSMDMLPATNYMLKRSLGDDPYDIYQMKLRYGYHPYATRNNLQLNRRNNMMSEAGLYAGIAATDWSWSCLWMDFDNNGWKDLFVSNGIPKRLNDIDYVAFVGDNAMQQKITNHAVTQQDFERIEQFPEIRLPNYFFVNQKNASFENVGQSVINNTPTFSNGAVYADLDNDGDLDIAVSNIADAALIYENQLAASARKNQKTVTLKGMPGNVNAIGARLIQFAGDEIRTYDFQPVHGYMSSMHIPLHIGLHEARTDSALLIWPDRTYEPIDLNSNGSISLTWKSGLHKYDFGAIKRFHKRMAKPMFDVAAQIGLAHEHSENSYAEFNREQLLPQMTSTDGPALTVGDMNGDGLDDVFFGSSRGFKSAVYFQQESGAFMPTNQPSLFADSTFEDVDAVLADVNGDGFTDLIVASGGNEYFGSSVYTIPRIYLNDGSGIFTKKPDAFTGIHSVVACIAANDFNNDGHTDLFLGSRCVPFSYGISPQHFLLLNDGSGKFTDVTNTYAPQLNSAGMIKQATWADADGDGRKDLMVAAHWQPLQIYFNKNGNLKKETVHPAKGFWNFLLPFDADGNGKMDLLAGNMGLNNRFKVSGAKGLKMYVHDFDNNGKKEPVLTYWLDDEEVLFAGKDELQKQLPGLKKRYLYAAEFAKAKPTDVFPEAQLKSALHLTINELANGLLMQQADGRYEWKPLPWLAQLSQYNDAIAIDANGDALTDILLAGNFFDNSISLGRNDADFGLLLINKGNGSFEPETLSDVILAGESRKLRAITIAGQKAVVVARNNGPAAVLMFAE